MGVLCQVCNVQDFKYKCPTCFMKYCSLTCFKTHRENPCEKPAPSTAEDDKINENIKPIYHFPTVDTVPVDKLEQLAESEEIKECLSNPHVRKILKSLVESKTPDVDIKEAMQEPIFLELAQACLKVVEPEKFEES
nr:EOG090X0JQ4 [Macrothrix elegans]